MTAELRSLALHRFEAYYKRLDEALDARDVDLVHRLVMERTDAVAQLIASQGENQLPDVVRTHLVACEEALKARLAALHAEIASALADQRQRGAATLRYTRG